MPGRNYPPLGTVGQYRYGNGDKEKDNELSAGAQYFGLREYDNRLGRFFGVDPYTRKFPNKTPYSFAGNCPIKFIDKNGGFMVIPDVSASGSNLFALQRVAKAVSQMANENGGDNLFLKTFMSQAGVSQEKALEILTYGSGPVILGTSNKHIIKDENGRNLAGVYLPNAKSDDKEVEGVCQFVFINNILLENVSNEDDKNPSISSLLLAAITLWHEGMHYADYLDLDVQPENKAKEDIGTQGEIALFGFRADYKILKQFYDDKTLQTGRPTGLSGYSLRYGVEIRHFWSKYSNGNLWGAANPAGRPKNMDLTGIKNTIRSMSKMLGKINESNRELESKDTGSHQNPRDLEDSPNSK